MKSNISSLVAMASLGMKKARQAMARKRKEGTRVEMMLPSTLLAKISWNLMLEYVVAYKLASKPPTWVKWR